MSGLSGVGGVAGTHGAHDDFTGFEFVRADDDGERRAAANRADQNASSMLTGLPWCSILSRIGLAGSNSPMAANLRSLSNTTAKSPGAPWWLADSMAWSNTHGWPARMWRSASGVTRTAMRFEAGRGS